MISVIIPVVNESDTVGTLVTCALAHPNVSEVIVVDDGSVDDTPDLARRAGARVLTSTFLGKGASLRDGLHAARSKVLVFLDAHLRELPPLLISTLAQPILDGAADLTRAGSPDSLEPVCVLTARPLLRTFFPELNAIDYPLSGVWAARRSLLQKLPFELDYGVEIGLLLDAVAAGARLRQVEVGPLAVKEEERGLLAETAEQVTRTILARAAGQNRLKASWLAEVQEDDRQAQADLVRVLQHSDEADRLAIFDLGGVLVRGDFVVELAHQIDKGAELAAVLDEPDLSEEERLQRIAALFTGVPLATFEQVAHEMPLMPGAKETVAALRKAGYLVGIVTDTFHVAAEIIRRRVFADFSIAHRMKFRRGKATGRLTFAPAMSHPQGCGQHRHCKANIIYHLIERLHIPAERILAVGNSENDICMLRAAGRSVAFRPTRAAVRAAATHVVEGALSDLLQVLEEQPVETGR